MPVDDTRLRDVAAKLDLKFTVEMDTMGTCHICYLTTTQRGRVRHQIQTPPVFGEQAAFDHALQTLIDLSNLRNQPIPKQYQQH